MSIFLLTVLLGRFINPWLTSNQGSAVLIAFAIHPEKPPKSLKGRKSASLYGRSSQGLTHSDGPRSSSCSSVHSSASVGGLAVESSVFADNQMVRSYVNICVACAETEKGT